MDSRKLKFGVGIAVILAIVAWEAVTGFQQSKTYYVTVKELTSGRASRKHIRVGGMVAAGSIHRDGTTLTFRLAQGPDSIPVTYVGNATLPDTFKDGAQAIIEGNYTANGQFVAHEVQAKCASKYNAAPPSPAPQSTATTATGAS